MGHLPILSFGNFQIESKVREIQPNKLKHLDADSTPVASIKDIYE